MPSLKKLLLFSAAILLVGATSAEDLINSMAGPAYTVDGQMRLPEQYRRWVYLSSGFDMSYAASMEQMSDHHMFDNVFVNPEAYAFFQEKGSWPDKTTMVLELRGAEGSSSINKKGSSQGGIMSIEVHVKDGARFPGKWAFFAFDEGKTAKMIPTSASCYSCHVDHGAVDTTFVQFYPTLLPIARQKGTFSAAFKKEDSAAAPR